MAKYRSKYCSTETMVAPAQYLAELMCERSARQRNIELPDHFWKIPKWNKLFRRHITQCNRLLKKYPAAAVVMAFCDNDAQDFLSFGNPQFIPIIEKNVKTLERRDKRALHKTTPGSITGQPRKPLGKKSIISKLRKYESEAN